MEWINEWFGHRLQATIVMTVIFAVLGAPFWVMQWRRTEREYRIVRDAVWSGLDRGDFGSIGRFLRQQLAEAPHAPAAHKITDFYRRALREYEKRKERAPKPVTTTT